MANGRLYFYILTLQLSVEKGFMIDEALRQSVVDEGGELQEVEDHGTFFEYLTETIMLNVFPAEWYNEGELYHHRVSAIAVLQAYSHRQRDGTCISQMFNTNIGPIGDQSCEWRVCTLCTCSSLSRWQRRVSLSLQSCLR